MTRTLTLQTSFTAGELDPRLHGRVDLKALGNGAAKLSNLLVLPTGGIERRPGTSVVRELPNATRLVAFKSTNETLLLAFEHERVSVLGMDGTVYSSLASPWTSDLLKGVDVAAHQGGLLMAHEARRLHRLHFDDPEWKLDEVEFDEERLDNGSARSFMPFARYAPSDVTMELDPGPSVDVSSKIPAGSGVRLISSRNVFFYGHKNSVIRFKSGRVFIANVLTETEALGEVVEAVPNGLTTKDWDEQAFSDARGYPSAITLHQDRLVLAAPPQARNRLWISKSGKPFNFDSGTGLDDEAISFALTSESRHDIVALVPGRNLQLFTTGGEWIVRGFPLTPSNVQAELQTTVGSARERRISPINIDGSTLFVSKAGTELCEFIFTDVEQAYQSADLALLARHLMSEPKAMAFDRRRRILWLVMAGGDVRAVTIDRNSNVVAWSSASFHDSVLDLVAADDAVFLLAESEGRQFLLRLDETTGLDHVIRQTSSQPSAVWTGLDLMTGGSCTVVGDGRELREVAVVDGSVDLDAPVFGIECGMRFEHEVVALPTTDGSISGGLGRSHRLVKAVFRVRETCHLDVQLGSKTAGSQVVLDSPEPASTDIEVRALGWQRAQDAPWRIKQDDHRAFSLLTVSQEIKVTN